MQDNNERIKRIATALGELGDRVVFVGGCVAQLYSNGGNEAEIRPTADVDCVVDLSSYKDYCDFCEQLRARHFSNDITLGAPICRWTFEDELIDFMPKENCPIGTSNRWYAPGLRHRIIYEISKGIFIRILPVIYYVGTKLEAILSRGGNDLRFSHDFEDLIYVLNYSENFIEEFKASDDNQLKDYFKEQFTWLLSRDNIREEIECALPYGEAERAQYILDIFLLVSVGIS